MKKEVKNVAVSKLEKLIDENVIYDVPIDENGEVVVRIKKYITFDSVAQIVDSVVNTCFMEPDGEYIPEVYELALRAAIIDEYTNVNLPSDTSKLYAIVMRTALYDKVKTHVDATQLNQIIRSINRKIAHVKALHIAAMTSEINKVVDLFSTLSDKMGKLADNTDIASIVDLTKKIENISETDLANAVVNKVIPDENSETVTMSAFKSNS